MERTTFSVVVLGVAFMFIFTSFQTQGNMQQVVIKSIQRDDSNFKGSGYISLAVIYAVFATFNWLAPSCLSFLGPKLTMIVGGVTYVIFIASFLWPQTWLLYLSSVLIGVGAALIWTGQGNYLTLMSERDTIARNSGIFWALFQSSLLFGNIFVFYMFMGKDVIDAGTRLVDDMGGPPLDALKKSFELFKTRDMILLSATFFYTGLSLSFFSGVYSTCVGSTLRFSDPTRLVGISGMCIGIGEISGGAIFVIFADKTVKKGRDPVVLIGFLTHLLAFFLIFLNLPTKSPLDRTFDPSFFPGGQPSEFVALLCSTMLGFGDACFNTQIYSILGSIYQDNSGPAFALYKFTQSLSAAACFFYSSVLELHWQLDILTAFCMVGTMTFCIVEWKVQVTAPSSQHGLKI
ncbi:putative UNC93-like protein MFSD11 [Penaeus vannamei]|uniref:UNC93-like protein MFSD11 n=1 Tax=Penaeus vannamei TaxID=6689 RepID=A0A423U7Y1_PENVA|nr:putative UNC93-like protein MFSD11 [Penaeus vannamei]